MIIITQHGTVGVSTMPLGVWEVQMKYVDPNWICVSQMFKVGLMARVEIDPYTLCGMHLQSLITIDTHLQIK